MFENERTWRACIRLLKEGKFEICEDGDERIFIIYETKLQELLGHLLEASGGLLGQEMDSWVRIDHDE